jgi:hypothetical protein
LLYRNLGTALRPVEEPSFGLYNRLDGRIRIFFYIEPNNENTPDNVAIRLSQYRLGESFKATALYENLNIPSNAIRNFDKDVSLGGMLQLNQGSSGSQWYLLEGVASYDPCLCQHESALVVEPTLTSLTSVGLDIDGTGNSQATYSAGSPVPTLGFFNGVADKFISGYKKYKTPAAYSADVQGSEDKTIKVLSSVLGGFAGVLGPVSGVTELLAFVTGKKSTASPPKLTGFNHNFSFTADGVLESNFAYDKYFFYTPGSFYRQDQLQAFKPVYDNPLGVFTVLEAPIVERQETDFYRDFGNGENIDMTTIRWRFAGGLRYHINTLAGISDQPVQLHASLVWTDCETKEDFYATPAVNITCLEDFYVEFEDIAERLIDPRTGELFNDKYFIGCNSEPQLQIIAVLTSTAPTPGQEILYSARYKTSTIRVLDGTFNGRTSFEDLTIEEVRNACTSNAIPQPVSGFALSRFCDRRYDPDFGKAIEGNEITEGNKSSSLPSGISASVKAFPNPFVNQFSLSLNQEWRNKPLQFRLRDALGRVVWEKKGVIVTDETLVLDSNFSGFPSGTYLLTILNDTSSETITLQKQ